ncbi:MAG TPA: Rieske 2Fe-2S domain-containing protein [Baekduia sp.]|uniref:ubiquinol-cytochrome c reductase iron-sulfur subunit n=1 Tax=Baekduia sp. TaxID=2600305 RepID=UPI002D76A729|nr:Rieske 2Fe-2S domain-containing protein [Baekduia sp.]HET6506063.1 Rieske 2Fe-2S domain-containing protein [Baekduia sp.]
MKNLLAGLLALWAMWRRLIRRHDEPARTPPPEVDPREREVLENRRAEGLAAGGLLASAGFAVAFIVLYVVYPNTPLLGATAGLSLVSLAVALMFASLRVVPQVTAVEDRGVLDHGPEAHEEVAEQLREGTEGISRRGLLVGAAGVCGGCVGVAALVPAASLGPRIGGRLAAGPWRAGRLLVDEDDRPITADRLVVGGFLTAFPEGADKSDLAAPVVVVRVDESEMHPSPSRADWSPRGYSAYSKICTHAGCAVSLFRTPLSPTTTTVAPALVCPCHYSTFDVTRGAEVTFGPAGRPLPQLPLSIDDAGRLRAAGPLSDKPGPAWWGEGGPRA